MPDRLGNNVTFVKGQNCAGKKMALTSYGPRGHNVPMKTAGSFNAEFTARIRELRAASGFTQQQMADILGVGFEAYRKYEANIMMPHRLLNRFALATKTDLNYLITGQHSAPHARRRA